MVSVMSNKGILKKGEIDKKNETLLKIKVLVFWAKILISLFRQRLEGEN